MAVRAGERLVGAARAWVAELTGLLDLSAWPLGMRVIARKERPHPGAQLRLTDIDGNRVTCFATRARGGQLADLELAHRRRARCEDRIRNAKDTAADLTEPASAIEAAMRLLLAALIATRADSDEHADCATAGPLLDVAETARLLKVSRMTVVRLIDERRMPAVIVRRGSSQKIRRIPRAFIQRLLAETNAGGQVDMDQFTATWLAELTPSETRPGHGTGYTTASSAREVRSAR